MLNSRYDEDIDLDNDSQPADREISVGTSSIVVIFFVLAIICAIFFGIGYTLGRRQVQPQYTPPVAATSSTLSSASKPSPGSVAKDSPAPAPSTPPPDQVSSANQSPAASSAPATNGNSSSAPVVPIKPTTSSSSTAGSALVQIAAVSHREDADVLVTALTRRGYDVSIRQEPQDKLLHVQIGPFPTRKDAEAMRQKLLADGYNAIVK